ncbi:aromatic ring hydroxylase [Secundilactobacillus paracollinoides]|uniref:Aromatic ring hydroxylase n=1 Tax=Secundilactobacillus paracollinoides TaxID=240427 RepID=A0A1B2IZJ4_9LACO|nr:metal-sulfur cluster assembly factor [Secundilactobacillus paracollinoides]ANZ61497.1 aromatic ring hydroxylase [Secundilactobacillus paracollinoides]ANZ64113.1 aromatic ring hydroxylase [Secundilactobacillus paracollinoides]ANZ67418.1 aromatic ring hydroxylase [Secundilactobacillus paracollinoides]KRL77485.1 hypothetical protein FC17_GL001311 [Secundilactobacillus paracollinoides DSM 15502 = JCM 11969]
MRDDIKLNDRAAALGDRLAEQLQTVIDPDIELDVYNLGLIYEVSLDETGHADVVTTITEIICDCIETLPRDLSNALTQLDEINSVSVKIVNDPVWEPTRISRVGRVTLGISVH